MAEEAEVTKVLESLVEDNETLKRDNAELQSLLTQSREDYHVLQEEIEEQRANAPSRGGGECFSTVIELPALTLPSAESPFSHSRRMLDPGYASSPSRKGNLVRGAFVIPPIFFRLTEFLVYTL
jgi:hypothetical protein